MICEGPMVPDGGYWRWVLPDDLSMVEEKQVVGDLDRNCPVFASVFLMLLRCGEDIPQLA